MCAFSARAARDELIKWWINLNLEKWGKKVENKEKYQRRTKKRGRGAHIVSNQRDLSDDVIKKLTMSGRCTPSSDPAAQSSRRFFFVFFFFLIVVSFFFARENFCRFERK